MDNRHSFIARRISASLIEEWIRTKMEEDPFFKREAAAPYTSERYCFSYSISTEHGASSKTCRFTIRNDESGIWAETESDLHLNENAKRSKKILFDETSLPPDQQALFAKLDNLLSALGASNDAETTQCVKREALAHDENAIDALFEGALVKVTSDRFERSRAARDACIAEHGAICAICRFDFGEAYGSSARGMIHVHHLAPLHKTRVQHQVNPIRDLIPVCANCHMVLHSKPNGVYAPGEVRSMLKRAKQQS